MKETVEDNARCFAEGEMVPRFVLTMGIGTLMEARQIVLMSSGVKKQEAIRSTVEGPVTATCAGIGLCSFILMSSSSSTKNLQLFSRRGSITVMSMKTKSASGISLRGDYRSGFITGCTIFTPLRRIEENGILFRNGRIVGFRKPSQPPEEVKHHRFEGCLAVPGFIDIHFHGASGINFLDGAVDSVGTALATHLKKGTTSCLPTLMTAPPDVIERAITAILEARQSGHLDS